MYGVNYIIISNQKKGKNNSYPTQVTLCDPAFWIITWPLVKDRRIVQEWSLLGSSLCIGSDAGLHVFLTVQLNQDQGLYLPHCSSINFTSHQKTSKCFWPGDLDLWPLALTFELDLDILPLDLHTKIQVCPFRQESGNRRTYTRCQNYYTHCWRGV